MSEDHPKEYTNRELYMLIDRNNETNLLQHKAILESLNTFHETTNKKLDELVAQTTKTNGNVKDLLLWRANVEGKTFIIPIVISAIVAGIIAFLFQKL